MKQKWKGIQSTFILSGAWREKTKGITLWGFYQIKNDPLASGVSNMAPTLNLRMSIKITAIIDDGNVSYPLHMLGWENKIKNHQ